MDFIYVTEEENALVQGIVTEDGLLDGSIVTKFEEYYIEPASRYVSSRGNMSPPYHTIAYRTSDVQSPPQPLSCSSHNLHRGKLRDSFKR